MAAEEVSEPRSRTGRDRAVVHAQRTIARTKAFLAYGTVVVGALQSQIPEHAGKGLVASIDIACGLPARAGAVRTDFVGGVRIESLLEGPCGELENGAAESHFGGFEIQFVDA